MTKSIVSLRACGYLVMWPLAGCISAAGQPRPVDRASQTSSILAEVFRYEIRQLAAEGTEASGSAMCVAVREGASTSDPNQSILRQLDKRVRPRSACGAAAVTLIAGPIDWLRDDELRVKGALLRAADGERPLAYRVVRKNGRWLCVGPVLSWDPL
jgi:hypothetical protein